MHEEVRQARAATNPTEKQKKLLAKWNAWERAQADLAQIRSETSKAVKESWKELKETAERSIPTGVDQEEETKASLQKLSDWKSDWDEHEEAKARARERQGVARERLKRAKQQFREAIESQNQLDLFDNDVNEAVAHEVAKRGAKDATTDALVKKARATKAKPAKKTKAAKPAKEAKPHKTFFKGGSKKPAKKTKRGK